MFTPERWAAFEALREDARVAKREIEAPEEEITEEEACAPAPAPGPAPAVEEAAPLPARRLEPREVDVFGHKADQDVVAPPPPVPADWDPEAFGPARLDAAGAAHRPDVGPRRGAREVPEA